MSKAVLLLDSEFGGSTDIIVKLREAGRNVFPVLSTMEALSDLKLYDAIGLVLIRQRADTDVTSLINTMRKRGFDQPVIALLEKDKPDLLSGILRSLSGDNRVLEMKTPKTLIASILKKLAAVETKSI